LTAQLGLGLQREILVVVADAAARIALVKADPMDLEKCSKLAHGARKASNLPLIRTSGYSRGVTAVPPPPPISARARPRTVIAGSTIELSGRVPGAPAGTVVRLSARPYPYRSSRPVASTKTVGAAGTFSLRPRPDRDTRYVVSVPGTSDTTQVTVPVTGKVVVKLARLPLGRARVTIVAFHPEDLRWGDARVTWAFASGRHGRFTPAPATVTRRLSPYVVALRTTIALPAGPYRFRACFTAPGAQALTNPGRPSGCPADGRGFTGSGSLPAGFPTAAAIGRAERALAARSGLTAFAVVDTEGRMSGVHLHRTFITGSVVKAMLLVAYLRRLGAEGQRTVPAASQAFLYPMIHVSDNDAATTCFSYVGTAGLYAVARAAGMTNFSDSVDWGRARFSAADQARFFFEMDSLIPRQFVGYARFLLSTIAGYESWGIPSVARPLGYRVFWKAGWRPTGLGQLVHQIARLEGHGRVFSMAIMTDGDPSMDYGIETLDDVTRALLG
jgi:hypothetical protein